MHLRRLSQAGWTAGRRSGVAKLHGVARQEHSHLARPTRSKSTGVWLWIYSDTAREHRAPAKDPAPSHPAYKHTYKLTYKHTYKTKQTHTYKHTHKNTHKHTQKHTHKTKQTRPSQTAPQKTKQQKYITLYNSQYCIRVVLRSKIDDIVCS